jgi:hypothetical protein
LESLSDKFFTCRGTVPHDQAVLVSGLMSSWFCKCCALARTVYTYVISTNKVTYQMKDVALINGDGDWEPQGVSSCDLL